MNASIHADLSCKKYNTTNKKDWNRFYKIHDFMDCSKECESTNKHRFLTHTMFFVKNVMIPIYGHTLTLSNGVKVNTKDMLESDHIAADFRGKFIPTIADYCEAAKYDEECEEMLDKFLDENKSVVGANDKVRNLFNRPLHISGLDFAAFITYSSWFCEIILPKLGLWEISEKIINPIPPSFFFKKMKIQPWMNNGRELPPSMAGQPKTTKTLALEDMIIDGSRILDTKIPQTHNDLLD